MRLVTALAMGAVLGAGITTPSVMLVEGLRVHAPDLPTRSCDTLAVHLNCYHDPGTAIGDRAYWVDGLGNRSTLAPDTTPLPLQGMP